MSCLLSLGLPAIVAAGPAADRAAVEETIRHYFRSGDENDAAELETAFHPTLGMYWVGKDGSPQALERRSWAERIRAATRRQPATLRRIDSLEVVGEMAVARLHSEFPTHQFEDVVTLLRVGGRWRIVLKVFHRREPADTPLPSPTQLEADRQAIRTVLTQTLQAIDEGDGRRLGSVALARAQTYSVEQGELVAVSLPEWQARLDRMRTDRTATAGRQEIDWIQVAIDVAAARMTRLRNEERTVSYLSLLKVDGGWRLVGVAYVRP